MPYTPTTWVENVTTLGPTNMNKIEQALALTSPAYGTTLPGSPVDGQEAILVDSTTNPTYQWRFRYNAGSSSAYKWEFVGGVPVYVETVGSDTTTATTGSNLANGPSWTVPRAGDWLIEATGITANTSGAGVFNYLNVGDSAVPTDQLLSSSFGQVSAANYWVTAYMKGRANGLAASTVLAFKVWLSGASTATWQARRLIVQPIRVSWSRAPTNASDTNGSRARTRAPPSPRPSRPGRAPCSSPSRPPPAG